MQSSATSSNALHASQQQCPPNARHGSHQHPPPCPVALSAAEETSFAITCHQSQNYYPEAWPIDPNIGDVWLCNQPGISGGVTHRDQHAPLLYSTPYEPQPTLTSSTHHPRTPPQPIYFIPQDAHKPESQWSSSPSIRRDRPGVTDCVESQALLSSMSRSGRYSPQHVGYAGNNGERVPNEQTSYRCRWNVGQIQCSSDIIGSKPCVERHLRACHKVNLKDPSEVACLWEGCRKRVPMKRENLARHLLTHMGVQYPCPFCDRKSFSRVDAVKRHIDQVHRDRDMQGRAIADHHHGGAGIPPAGPRQR